MKSTYKILAVDDEIPALDLIKAFCRDIEEVEFVHCLNDASRVEEFLRENDVDIAILDIEMPGLNGLQLASRIGDDVKVIFSTAYPNYAVEGFNLSVVDYILKPYSKERFKTAVQKAIDLLKLQNSTQKKEQKLTIKVNYINRSIALNEIRFFESLNNNILIHMDSGEVINFRETIKNLLNKIPQEKFMRIHRSYVIPLDKVSQFGHYKLTIGEQSLPISAPFRSAFLDRINKL